MLKVFKVSVSPSEPSEYSNSTTFEGYKKDYPLIEIKKCDYSVILEKVNEYIIASFLIKGNIVLADSRDGVHFEKKISIKEKIDILEKEDGSGEGMIVDSNFMDLDDIALRLISSSLPIRVVRDNDPIKRQGGENFVIMSEEEYESEKESEYNPAFDALADLDLDE